MTDKLDQATLSMIHNLETSTGKSFAEWQSIAASSGLDKHAETVNWLKQEHGLTHGYANLVVHAERSNAAGNADPVAEEDLVAAQYAGSKAALKPVYDAIVKAAQALGDDVEIAPKNAYVSLRRNKQFAIVQPSTATRIDVGLNLRALATTVRLEPSGGFSAMVSHRVRVNSAQEVDAEFKRWLQQAYDVA